MTSTGHLLLLFIIATAPIRSDAASNIETAGYRIRSTHTESHVNGFRIIFDLPHVQKAPALSRGVAQAMAQFRRKRISSLRGYCAEVRANDNDYPCEGEQQFNFTIVQADRHLLSVRIESYTNTKSAAHPSHDVDTFTWLATGRLLSLEDLFLPGVPFLGRLSDLARTKLSADQQMAAYADREWIDRGTAPATANFRAWTISNGKISFIFNEYQVAQALRTDSVVRNSGGWSSRAISFD